MTPAVLAQNYLLKYFFKNQTLLSFWLCTTVSIFFSTYSSPSKLLLITMLSVFSTQYLKNNTLKDPNPLHQTEVFYYCSLFLNIQLLRIMKICGPLCCYLSSSRRCIALLLLSYCAQTLICHCNFFQNRDAYRSYSTAIVEFVSVFVSHLTLSLSIPLFRSKLALAPTPLSALIFLSSATLEIKAKNYGYQRTLGALKAHLTPQFDN